VREAGAFFVAAALALAASTSSAQERLPVAEALRRGQWPASWIAAAEGPERDAAVFHFRKSLRLEAVPSRFIVHVSADNRYLLHVNGRRVGAGPARSDLLHWAFEAYDLAPDLRAGDNLVAATVWNFGTLAPMAQISRRTGFLVQGDDEAAAALNTGRAWEGALDPGHGPNPSALGPLRARHFYYAAGPGERRDGSLFDWEWDEPGARSSRWRPAREIGHAYPHAMRDGPGWMLSPEGWLLEPSSIPPMEHREIGGGRVVRSTSLRRVEAAMPTPRGEIAVAYKRTGESGLEAEVTLPSEVSGVLVWCGRAYDVRAGAQRLQVP
jgi:hypothetical protein